MTDKQDLREAYIQGYKEGNGGLWSELKAKTAQKTFERWFDLNLSDNDE